MCNTASLNDLYADFSAGLLEKRDFEGAIFRALGEDVHRFSGLDKNDYEDYIVWLYPRISSAINKYQETGSSFEAYINTLVRLTAKEYRSRQMRGYAAEFSVWFTQIPELYTCEDAPQYDENAGVCSAAAPRKPARLKNPRQLLILLLKCSSYVSPDFLERVSPRLGIKPEVLSGMIEQLREQRVKREREINLLRERANCQFFRCIFYEKSLQSMPHNSITARRMRERLERGRARLIKMRKRLARLRPDPSNRQIAEVLGLTKGTVDAALHRLKVKWNIELDRNMLN